MSKPRKPAWLHALCPPNNLMKLVPMRCSCGQWVISCRNSVWQSYDPGIITGDDLTIAIVLDAHLTCVQWDSLLEQAMLVDVCGAYGLSPENEYLALHHCYHTPISMKPFKPSKRMNQKDDLSFLQGVCTDEDVKRFIREWNQPLPIVKAT